MSAPGSSNMITITDEQHAEILRILGPVTPQQRELWAQVEEQEKIVLEEMMREEEKKEELYTKYRQSQGATNPAEMAAFKRFHSLPDAEKQRQLDEAQKDMGKYLMSREEFMKDLEKRMAEEAEDSEVSDEDEDVDDEEEDEDEEEEEEGDWKEAWKKMTGFEWGNLAEEVWGPVRQEPVPIMGPEEIFRRLCRPQFESWKEQKLAKSNLFAQPTPQPTRDIPDVLDFGEGPSSSEVGTSRSVSRSSDSSSDFPMTMNQFFASRPTTPLNRETPDKFDLIAEGRESMVGQPPSLFNNSKSMPANRFQTSSGPKKAFPNVKKPSKSHKFAPKRAMPTRILPPRMAKNAKISKFGVDSD
ncbi:hypothetical protein B9Z55_000376 [Caenorhabditis nigoni]|uniref:Uncharacterized protein n=1 Tax=Caenorhabditis nigoni TaxID=1611254 RepID=A0A2G5VS20_9PELO|nr:hypothetical protein B9Z55_000376 [Caenorhabditis nigoni]